MNLELALVGLYLSGHICPLSMLRVKFPWRRRNFVECTINKKSHDLLPQFVNDRYS